MKKKLIFAIVMICVLLFVGCSNAEVNNTGESNSSTEGVLGEEAEAEGVLGNSSEGSTEVYYVCKCAYDVDDYYGARAEETFYYDENGILTQSVDGLITYDYIYDESGRIVKVCATELVDLKERKEYLTIEYDENNKVLSGKWYKDENEEEYVRGIEYIYDENGKLLQSIELYSTILKTEAEKSVFYCCVEDFYYYESGNLQKEAWHYFYCDESRVPLEESDYKDYEDTFEKDYEDVEAMSDDDTTYTYNPDGNLIKKVYVHPINGDKYTYSYSYDEYGNFTGEKFLWYSYDEKYNQAFTDTEIDEFVWNKVEVTYDMTGTETGKEFLEVDRKICEGVPQMPEEISKLLLYR